MSDWRVGGKVPLNVYEGDRPVFQCHTPEEAQRVVELLNMAERCQKAEAKVQTYEHQLEYHHAECPRIHKEYLKMCMKIKKLEAELAKWRKLSAGIEETFKVEYENPCKEKLAQAEARVAELELRLAGLLRCTAGHIHNQPYGQPCPMCQIQADKARLDWLDRLEALRQRACVHQILFRVAGVAIMFYDPAMCGFCSATVYKYYPTLKEAVEGEHARLDAARATE